MDNEILEKIEENDKFLVDVNESTHGLSVAFAILFIVGEMAGSGILALPRAVGDSGYVGILMLIFCAAMAGYTGSKLGKCWEFILSKHNELKGSGDPYPAIAEKAVGNWMKIIVNISVYLTLCGACVVLLIICSMNISLILNGIFSNLSITTCMMLPIVGLILIPFGWLKSPADMPWIAFFATLTTLFACIFITTELINEGFPEKEVVLNATKEVKLGGLIPHFSSTTNESEKSCPPSPVSVFIVNCPMDVFSAFGKILFCFGGMAVFPSIQTDMKEPKKFTRVVILSVSAIVAMMIPVAFTGYFFHAGNVSPNILKQLNEEAYLTIIANILLTSHLLFAFVIIQNPIALRFEIPFGVTTFGLKRVLIRSAVSCTIIFIGATCPKFDFILSLIGGTTVTLNTFIFPSLFYICLIRKHSKKDPIIDEGGYNVEIPIWEYAIHFSIMSIGVIFGTLSTVETLGDVIKNGANFVPPCYVDSNPDLGNVSH